MSISFPGIGLNLPYVGKSLRLLGMDVSFYGILIAIGMVLALSMMILEAKRRGQDPNHFLSAMIVAFLLGTVCSRAFYVACYWPLYEEDPFSALWLRGGGMAIYGAILGGWLGVSIVAKACHAKSGKMLDVIAPSLLLGQAIGRLGDFFNRGSFGEYTTFLTRMRLPLESVSAGQVTDLMRENLQTVGDSSYILVHPTFLYESLWCIFLMICLMVMRRRKLFDGEIFWRYLVGYGLGRAPIEYLRTDKMMLPGVEEKLPINLVLSLFFVVFGSLVLFVRRSMTRMRLIYRNKRREEGREREEQYLREESRLYLSDIEEEVGLRDDSQPGERKKGSPLPDDVRHLLEDMEEEQRRFAAQEKERWRKAVAAKEGGEAPASNGPATRENDPASYGKRGGSSQADTPKENPFAGLDGASSLRKKEKRMPYAPFHVDVGDGSPEQDLASDEKLSSQEPSEGQDLSSGRESDLFDEDGKVSREDLEKLLGGAPVRERDYLEELESDLEAIDSGKAAQGEILKEDSGLSKEAIEPLLEPENPTEKEDVLPGGESQGAEKRSSEAEGESSEKESFSSEEES